jgi:hypothetical protein
MATAPSKPRIHGWRAETDSEMITGSNDYEARPRDVSDESSPWDATSRGPHAAGAGVVTVRMVKAESGTHTRCVVGSG